MGAGCGAFPVESSGSAASGGSAGELLEAQKLTVVLGFQHFLPENGVPLGPRWPKGVRAGAGTPTDPKSPQFGAKWVAIPPFSTSTPQTQNFEPDLAVIV